MFSDKNNVNILTSLLVAHGVKHVVVCPGSRNSPLAHNFFTHPKLVCHPVTDERSAGFYALGMIQATNSIVAVCVTSGSALLNVAPAVAEAAYQQLPLVVISADRPTEWIGQLDGQTIRQPGALASLVAKTVDLPASADEENMHWLCNRLVNEALLAATFPVGAPVHINVPIAEPLFEYNTESLPVERVVRIHRSQDASNVLLVAKWLLEAQRPMIVVGQYHGDADSTSIALKRAIAKLEPNIVMLAEKLCRLPLPHVMTDEAMVLTDGDDAYKPDLILYAGATLVSKRLRQFLRKVEGARVVMMSQEPELHDVTAHLTDVVQIQRFENILFAAAAMAEMGINVVTKEKIIIPQSSQKAFRNKWQYVFDFAERCNADFMPPFSQMAAVRYLEQQFDDMEYDFHTHYANSSAVRLANIYACHPVYCNRGVNGIEGSLSAAAGFSLATNSMVFCVIGDLSFFYDQNALWNSELKGNLRILLLNNGGGGIFRQLAGLQKSKARDSVVAACHNTEAEGICIQNDIGYIRARTMREMQVGIVKLLTSDVKRPMVLEITTNAEDDASAIQQYYNQLQQLWQKENGKK